MSKITTRNDKKVKFLGKMEGIHDQLRLASDKTILPVFFSVRCGVYHARF